MPVDESGIDRLGVFATEEELARIKRAADTPIMSFGSVGNPIMLGIETAVQAAEAVTAAHGFPVDGSHGLDIKTGEFFKVRNAAPLHTTR